MAVTRVVTVVFPFVPVTAATRGPRPSRESCAASSISARTGTPAFGRGDVDRVVEQYARAGNQEIEAGEPGGQVFSRASI